MASIAALLADCESAPAQHLLEMVRGAVSRGERDVVHVSEALCSLRAWARRNGYGSEPGLAEAAQWIDGLAWDEWLRHILPGRAFVLSQGKTYYACGLAFSPDAVIWEEGIGVSPIEFKHTRYSSEKPVEQMDSFLWQLALYCALLPQAIGVPVQGGYLLLLHSLGDYKGAKRPQLAAWRVRWPADTLERLVAEAQRRARAIAGNRQPDPDAIWPWLCRECTEGRRIGCPALRRAQADGDRPRPRERQLVASRQRHPRESRSGGGPSAGRGR